MLELNPEEYTRIDDISSYNSNYYRHIDGHVIYEECDELNQSYSFYLVEDINDQNTRYDNFLGESYTDLDSNQQIPLYK